MTSARLDCFVECVMQGTQDVGAELSGIYGYIKQLPLKTKEWYEQKIDGKSSECIMDEVIMPFVDNVFTDWLNPAHYYYCWKGNTGLRNFLCRLVRHPCGYWFYNYRWEASEPDYHCKNCNEEIF